MTDAHNAAIEAMARAASDAQLGVGVWKSFSDSLRNDWLKSAEAHYTTLLEHLAATGWQVVPKVATETIGAAMERAPFASGRDDNADGWSLTYEAALAAAPKFGGPDV